MLPRVLKNFTAFADGRGLVGKVDECEPPKLTLKTEEFRGGGMDAPIDHDMGMEKLEMKMSLAEYNPEMVKLFGKTNMAYTLRGSIQRQGEDAVPVVIKAFGMMKEIDKGSWKAGERGQYSHMIAIQRLEIDIAGEQVVLIDVENMIRVIGGEDQLASQRAALGI